MNITINVPVRVFVRVLRALEKIAANYETVHAKEIAAAHWNHNAVKAGTTFYQDDRAIYEAELEAKVREAAETGMF